jgi:hypothetical protein
VLLIYFTPQVFRSTYALLELQIPFNVHKDGKEYKLNEQPYDHFRKEFNLLGWMEINLMR